MVARPVQELGAVRPATLARALGLSPVRVQQLIRSGDVEVIKSADGAVWVPVSEIARLRAERSRRRSKTSRLRREAAA